MHATNDDAQLDKVIELSDITESAQYRKMARRLNTLEATFITAGKGDLFKKLIRISNEPNFDNEEFDEIILNEWR